MLSENNVILIMLKRMYVKKIFNTPLKYDDLSFSRFVRYPVMNTNNGMWKVYMRLYIILIIPALLVNSIQCPNTTIRISAPFIESNFLFLFDVSDMAMLTQHNVYILQM